MVQPPSAMAQVDARNLVAADAEQKIQEGVERLPSTTGPEEIVRSFISTETTHGTAKGNVKVLALTAFLFGTITAVQWIFGGVVTHSAALLADCHCMLVDALTYFLNIWVELAPARLRTPLRLTVPCISLTVLAVLTGLSIQDAVDVFSGKGGGDDMNPWIVWSFGFAGLLFDCISIYAFWRNKRRGVLPVNMLAAFMHVGADFIRSLTTTIEGTMLFIFKQWDGDMIDAVNTVVIVVLIYIGILYGLYEAIVDIRAFTRSRRQEEQEPTCKA
jgi:Co/Zn/Cd efflux system component